ncbi:hypothetical protein [Vagococcus salmoninarum]|uniref:hypothetical protein n=1 Tax=Vagococcus salmoninarum TaxID=2739 RepID=UPI0028D3B661|nr:hypothetical protein [Vagococcus salmoninarum]
MLLNLGGTTNYFVPVSYKLTGAFFVLIKNNGGMTMLFTSTGGLVGYRRSD